MQYKTVVMELIEENPTLHEELRTKRRMLEAIESFARILRRRHLKEARTLESNIAFEIALQEIRQVLSPQDSPFNLDEAMEFLQRHSPPA